ncbi:hypothetical protein ACFLTT_02245 [Chloroflexota bacterium]
MLPHPYGINYSVKHHNSDMDIFCDWIEAEVMFKTQELSQTDVLDYLMEQQIYVSQEYAAEFVSLGWSQMKHRLGWLGDNSPIYFKDRRMYRVKEWMDVPAYSFCLLVSLGIKYDEWESTFGTDYTEQGRLFEHVTAEAMKKIFHEWEFEITGWSRDNTSNIKEIVASMAFSLDENVGDLEKWTDEKAKDAGVDVYWHLPFVDKRGGSPVYLVQCASGSRWKQKLDKPNLQDWNKYIDWVWGPSKAFSIPFALPENVFRRRCNGFGGLFLDRYRLLSGDGGETDWVSDSLRTGIADWLKLRIEWLVGLSIS